MTGPSLLPFNEVWKALFQLGEIEETTKVIVYELRLPMAIMALVVGAALVLAELKFKLCLIIQWQALIHWV